MSGSWKIHQQERLHDARTSTQMPGVRTHQPDDPFIDPGIPGKTLLDLPRTFPHPHSPARPAGGQAARGREVISARTLISSCVGRAFRPDKNCQVFPVVHLLCSLIPPERRSVGVKHSAKSPAGTQSLISECFTLDAITPTTGCVEKASFVKSFFLLWPRISKKILINILLTLTPSRRTIAASGER